LANWPGSVGTCYVATNVGCHVVVGPLSTGGQHTFVWGANSNAASELTFWLSNDLAPTLQPGMPRQINIERYGQNARLHFEGVAGDGVSINLADMQLTDSNVANIYVFDPNNVQLPSSLVPTRSVGSGGMMVNILRLPSTGTYTMLVSPDDGGLATFEATLDPGIPLIVDGPQLDLLTDLPGKGYRLVIDGKVDEKIGLGLLGLDFGGGSAASANIYVYAPDGTSLTNFSCPQRAAPAPGCERNLGPLPIAGKYAITIIPSAPAPWMSLHVQATTDRVFAPGSSPINANVLREGGNARLEFLGIPGQGQTINVSNYVSTPIGTRAWLSLLRPDDSPINARTPLYHRLDISSGNGAISIGDFPIRGTYTIFIDPFDAAKMSTGVSISSGVDVVVGQVPVHKAVVPGPWARTTFTGQVGDHVAVGLDIASIANPTGSTVTLSVFDPNGHSVPQRGTTALTSTCATSTGGCDFDMPEMALSGEYQVLAELPVSTPDDASVSFSVNPDVEIFGNSGTFSLSARGQNGRLYFTGSSGTSARVTVTRNSVTGSGRDIVLNIYASDGTRIGGTSLSGTRTTVTTIVNSLPATGEYLLEIDPSNGFPTDVTATVE
jgi:large repetitive protein